MDNLTSDQIVELFLFFFAPALAILNTKIKALKHSISTYLYSISVALLMLTNIELTGIQSAILLIPLIMLEVRMIRKPNDDRWHRYV